MTNISRIGKSWLVTALAIVGVIVQSSCGRKEPITGEFTEGQIIERANYCVERKSRRPITGLLFATNHANQRISQIPYVEGKRHGVAISWYDNGQKWQEITYERGVEHGISKFWHRNGNLKAEFNENNGSYHGTFREWNENGELVMEAEFANGKPVRLLKGDAPPGWGQIKSNVP